MRWHDRERITKRQPRPRKLAALFTCTLFLLGLSACQTAERPTRTQSENQQTAAQTQSETDQPPCPPVAAKTHGEIDTGRFTATPNDRRGFFSPRPYFLVTGEVYDATYVDAGIMRGTLRSATLRDDTGKTYGTYTDGKATFLSNKDLGREFSFNAYVTSGGGSTNYGFFWNQDDPGDWNQVHLTVDGVTLSAPGTGGAEDANLLYYTPPRVSTLPPIATDTAYAAAATIRNRTTQPLTVSQSIATSTCGGSPLVATQKWPPIVTIAPHSELTLPPVPPPGNSFGQVQICGTSCLYAMWGMSSPGPTQLCVPAPAKPQPEPSTQTALTCIAELYPNGNFSHNYFYVDESSCQAPFGGPPADHYHSTRLRIFNCTPINVYIKPHDVRYSFIDANPDGKMIAPGQYLEFGSAGEGIKGTEGWARLCSDNCQGESPSTIAEFNWSNLNMESNKGWCNVRTDFAQMHKCTIDWSGGSNNVLGIRLCSPPTPDAVCRKGY